MGETIQVFLAANPDSTGFVVFGPPITIAEPDGGFLASWTIGDAQFDASGDPTGAFNNFRTFVARYDANGQPEGTAQQISLPGEPGTPGSFALMRESSGDF